MQPPPPAWPAAAPPARPPPAAAPRAAAPPQAPRAAAPPHAPRATAPLAAPQRGLSSFFAPVEAPPEEPLPPPEVDADGLAECSLASAGMRVDPVAAQTYHFPAQTEQRAYQASIVRVRVFGFHSLPSHSRLQTCLFQNTLVCLPTGLGKTLIAAVTMHAFYRWFPKGKVVFLAPTRPLVQQQSEACRQQLGIPAAHICELMGSTPKDGDGRRGSAWAARRVFFCTPQTFDNDVRNAVVPSTSIVCLVLDEAHRATGQYAYCTAVAKLRADGARFRLLALSATPGASRDAVQAVITTLGVRAVEYRGEDDPDVAPYTHARALELLVVKPSAAQADAAALYAAGCRPALAELQSCGCLGSRGEDPAALLHSVYTFVKARQELGSNPARRAALGPRAGRAMQLLIRGATLARGFELLVGSGLRSALEYLVAEKAEAWMEAMAPPLAEALRLMRTSCAGGDAHAPKLDALTQLLRAHFAAAAAAGAGAGAAAAPSRAIVFSSSRESVRTVLTELRSVLSPLGLACSEFVGQGESAGGVAGGAKAKGQTQAEQAAVLAGFRAGRINLLVATCIGEEGLDVPQVDLVVFMDLVGGIRAVQRMGRTGRARAGRVVALLAEGREEAGWAARQAEQARMAALLRNAEQHFTMAPPSASSRMLPHRYKPRVHLVAVAEQVCYTAALASALRPSHSRPAHSSHRARGAARSTPATRAGVGGGARSPRAPPSGPKRRRAASA